MLVDDSGMFITQRQLPKLAMLRVEILGARLVLHWPNSPPLSVQTSDFAARKNVTIWRSDVEAAIAESTVNKTLSTWLETARLPRPHGSRQHSHSKP